MDRPAETAPPEGPTTRRDSYLAPHTKAADTGWRRKGSHFGFNAIQCSSTTASRISTSVHPAST
jgi:hypothetical protein